MKKFWYCGCLTCRTLFVVPDAREQYRIASGSTANTEREEAMFTDIKKFASETSNHQPENVISNAAIR